MTRRFRVTIGGVTYNVDVEEVGAPAAPALRSAPAPSVPAAAVAPVPAPAPTPAPAPAPAAEGGQQVKAPLPGQIVDVKVEVGQTVNAGDILLVLEAMKMENDIASPFSGTVKQVLVSKGSSVQLSDLLVVIG